MGGRGSKEIHHYHEDKESKELARQTNEQLQVLQGQMEEQQRRSQEQQQLHQEALRNIEQLHAEERAAASQRLQQEQEERQRDSDRARVQLEQQTREAREHLAQELQRVREEEHKAKLEKWQRLKRDYPIPDFLKNYVNEVSETADADAARERFVNVAMLGDSGTGKSSLIIAILKHFGVDLPEDQMPRVSMEGDGTLEPTPFPLANLGQVSLWDLPGQGTAKIPSMTYLCNYGLKYFDAVVIVTDGRWSEGDDNLLAAIHYAGIRCFVVRSKVDIAVENGEEDKGWSQDQTLDHVLSQLQQQTRLKPNRIHLVTSRRKFWKDYGSIDGFCKQLQQEVNASLRDEPVEPMFDQEPRDDVNMDAVDDVVMAPGGPGKVEYLRLDVDNNCFKPVGFLKRPHGG